MYQHDEQEHGSVQTGGKPTEHRVPIKTNKQTIQQKKKKCVVDHVHWLFIFLCQATTKSNTKNQSIVITI